MKNLLLLFLMASSTFGFGQTTFNFRSHDFVDLEAYSDRFVDLIITNNGAKKEYMLSVKKPNDVIYIVTGQSMEKDSSIVVRFQVNPKKKGKFKYEIDVFTSDKNEARQITLSGNLMDEPKDNFTAYQNCPSFVQWGAGEDLTAFLLTVVTIDKDTKEPLGKSYVTLIQNGKTIDTYRTKKDGKIIEKVPLGYSYFYAKHEGYYPTELGTYNFTQRSAS